MSPPLPRTVGLWVLRILVALVFLMTGSHKLLGDPMMVGMFGKIGLGQGLRYVTGGIEVIAALMVLLPRASFMGAVLALLVLAGAFVTQAAILHGDVIHVIVIAILVGALAYFTRPRATAA